MQGMKNLPRVIHTNSMIRSSFLLTLLAGELMAQTFAAKMGPAVGSPIPPFAAIDQNGKTQTFASVKGPKGAFVLFIRSADW